MFYYRNEYDQMDLISPLSRCVHLKIIWGIINDLNGYRTLKRGKPILCEINLPRSNFYSNSFARQNRVTSTTFRPFTCITRQALLTIAKLYSINANLKLAQTIPLHIYDPTVLVENGL